MSGYYNQGGYPPPQGGGYPPPHAQQPGYGYQQPPPQGQYPPSQGFAPPPGPPPQQAGYGYPPPQGYPPQGPPQGYPPPQHGFAPPPGPPQGYGAPPPQGHYPPPQQQNYGPPALPSPGYDPNQQAQGNATNDANALRKAMKGFGTDEKVLIQVLSKPDPLGMALLRNTFNQQHKRDLASDIKSETSGYFEETLLALVRGPLMQDAHNVRDAIKGLGTKETVLNDVLCSRSNADMRAIKQAYQKAYNKTLESDVSGDLSMKTEQHFKIIMAANRAEESTPINPQQVDQDCNDLHRAMEGRGTDEMLVCSIVTLRSDGQLRAIAQQFERKYQTSLEKRIKSDFSGHMKAALLLIVARGTDRAMSDAIDLEEAMAGMGTKDSLLLNRVVRIHWNRAHMDQVKRAYKHKYKRELIDRVKGETSGDYGRLLVACLT